VPPTAMSVSFGPMSCPLHITSAEALGIEPLVHDLARFPGFALDVDTPEDVARLGGLGGSSHTRLLLETAGGPGALPLISPLAPPFGRP